MKLDTELTKLLCGRLGIFGPDQFGKLMSLQQKDFRGGIVKGETVFFILLSRSYETHTDNFLSIRCDDKNYYIGFAYLKDGTLDIENVLFCEKTSDRWVPCNTAMKLSVSLFVEMFANLQSPPEFVTSEDHSLYEFEKFYVSSFPEDI